MPIADDTPLSEIIAKRGSIAEDHTVTVRNHANRVVLQGGKLVEVPNQQIVRPKWSNRIYPVDPGQERRNIPFFAVCTAFGNPFSRDSKVDETIRDRTLEHRRLIARYGVEVATLNASMNDETLNHDEAIRLLIPQVTIIDNWDFEIVFPVHTLIDPDAETTESPLVAAEGETDEQRLDRLMGAFSAMEKQINGLQRQINQQNETLDSDPSAYENDDELVDLEDLEDV